MSACACLILLAPWLMPDDARGSKAAPAGQPVEEIPGFASSGRLVLVPAAQREITASPGDRLLLTNGVQPVAWCEFVEVREDRLIFRLVAEVPAITPSPRWRAWLVRADLNRELLERWPPDAELCATIDSVGPGAHAVWLSTGRTYGVCARQTWLRRLNGQPVARLEARLVQDDLVFCSVVRLVADLRLSVGDAVALWPAPGDRRTGQVRTAVAYVEPAGEAQIVWIAAPPGGMDGSDARVDVYRGRQYVGHAVVERWDERFWYARSLSAAGAGPIRVGDDVRVRRPIDKSAGRLVARVFEVAPQAMINAGELDGLLAGETGVVYRGGQRLGTVEVQRTQPNYAVVRVAAGSAVFEIQRLDEVCFGPTPPEPRLVGRIVGVSGATLFTAALGNREHVPPLGLLSVRTAEGRVAGVGLLVAREPSQAGGFVIPESLVLPLRTGQELWYEGAASRHQETPPGGGAERATGL